MLNEFNQYVLGTIKEKVSNTHLLRAAITARTAITGRRSSPTRNVMSQRSLDASTDRKSRKRPFLFCSTITYASSPGFVDTERRSRENIRNDNDVVCHKL